MHIKTRSGFCRICTTLVLASSVMATHVFPSGPVPQYPPHNPERLDIASLPMNTVERRDLLGHILPIGSKPSDSSAPAPAPAQAAAPAAASMPPPPSSPTDPNSIKSSNSGVLPGLINGVLSPTQPTSTTGSMPPTMTNKVFPTTTADTNGDGIPDNQQGILSASSTHKQSKSDDDSVGNSSLPAGLIALIVLFGLVILGALVFSCLRIRAARQRRTRRFDDEDILKNHAGTVGYSAGGGYGVYMEKERPDIFSSRPLDMFHRNH